MTRSSAHEVRGPASPTASHGSSLVASVGETGDPSPAGCRLDGIDVGKLRKDVAACFTRSGIHRRYIDTVVVRCLLVVSTRVVENPLNYCLAIGRRLQDESAAEKTARWAEFQRRIANTCPHESNVEQCPACAEDRAHALELFPEIRRHLSTSFAKQPIEDERRDR